MENRFPETYHFNDFQLIFNECLTELENQNDLDFQVDINLVSQFLINSWFGVLLRVKSNEEVTNPLEGFKDFILQQLNN